MSADLVLQVVNEALKTSLQSLNTNIYNANTNRLAELLQTVETTLGDITISNAGIQDKQAVAIGGNVYDSQDVTLLKVGAVAGVGAGGVASNWYSLMNATTAIDKHKINKLNYYLDLPSVPIYMPGSVAYFIAIKKASFSPTLATNFADIKTSCYLRINTRLNAGFAGTGQVYPHAGDKLIGTPAGLAPPEALLITPLKLRISFTPNKAMQAGGFSIWGWQNPIFGLTTETMGCSMEYTIQSGGTL